VILWIVASVSGSSFSVLNMCTNRESSLDSLPDFDASFAADLAADLAATRAERQEPDKLVVSLGFDTSAAFFFRASLCVREVLVSAAFAALRAFCLLDAMMRGCFVAWNSKVNGLCRVVKGRCDERAFYEAMSEGTAPGSPDPAILSATECFTKKILRAHFQAPTRFLNKDEVQAVWQVLGTIDSCLVDLQLPRRSGDTEILGCMKGKDMGSGLLENPDMDMSFT
jgi:hypothetical protein